jgi:hypothetical protein
MCPTITAAWIFTVWHSRTGSYRPQNLVYKICDRAKCLRVLAGPRRSRLWFNL